MPGMCRYSPIESSIQPKLQLSAVAKDLPLGLCLAGMKLNLGNASLFCASKIFFWIKYRRWHAQAEIFGPETSVVGHHRTVGFHVVVVASA